MITCNLSNNAQLKFLTYVTTKLKDIKNLSQTEAIKEIMKPFGKMSEGDKFQYYSIVHNTLAAVVGFHLQTNTQDIIKFSELGLDPTSLYKAAASLKTSEDVEALYKTESFKPSYTQDSLTLAINDLKDMEYQFDVKSQAGDLIIKKLAELNALDYTKEQLAENDNAKGVLTTINLIYKDGQYKLVGTYIYNNKQKAYNVNVDSEFAKNLLSQHSPKEKSDIEKAMSGLAEGVKGSIERAMSRELKEKGETGRAKRHPKETDAQWDKRVQSLERIAVTIEANMVNIGDEIWLTTKTPLQTITSLKSVNQQRAYLENTPYSLNIFTEWYNTSKVFRVFDEYLNKFTQIKGKLVFYVDDNTPPNLVKKLETLGTVRTKNTKVASEGKVFLINGKYLAKELKKNTKGGIKVVKLTEPGKSFKGAKIVYIKNIKSIEEISLNSDMNFVSLKKTGLPQNIKQNQKKKNIDLFLEERGIENDSLYRQLEESGIISIVC